MRVAITGANRGIGLELTVQYLARGDEVWAGVRYPKAATELRALDSSGRLHIHTCDVRRQDSVARFASRVGDNALDVLINNAGISGKSGSLDALDSEDMLRTFDTNALGALRMVKHLLPSLRRGDDKKLVAITSGMGSIGDNHSGGAYAYRLSKAALNMAHRNLHVELKREGFISVVVNPGWVQTDMGGLHAPTPVAESASKIVALIDKLGVADGGKFFDYRGHTWPW